MGVFYLAVIILIAAVVAYKLYKSPKQSRKVAAALIVLAIVIFTIYYAVGIINFMEG